MMAAVLAGCGFSQGVHGDGHGAATVGFLASTSLQDELSGSIMLPIALDAPAGGVVTVHYRFSGGTAMNGPDYQGSDNTISIPPGATEGMIPLTINEDGMEEPSETIEIALSDPTNAVLGTSRHTITISSDILPRVNFTVPTSAADETSSPTLVLSLDGPSTSEVSVDYVVNGTATAGLDFALTQGTAAFPPGTTTQSIALPVMDDALDEFDENVLVTLTSSSNVVVGAAASHDHSILDNDQPPGVAFSQTQQSKGENTNTLEVGVQLSGPSGKPITVDVAQGPSPAIAAALGEDFALPASATLTFAPGEVSKTFVVTLLDDTTDEFDEGFSLVFANAMNVTPSATADQVTLTDNDPLPTVSVTTASRDVSEGDQDANYPYVVTIDRASAKPIEVVFSFAGGDANNPDDYTVIGEPVQIAPGMTTGTVTIRVRGDNIRENNSNGTEEVHIAIGANAALTNVQRGGNTRVLKIFDDD